MNELKPEQALQILDQATAQLNLPRLSHAQIIQALEVLKKVIIKQNTNPETKDPTVGFKMPIRNKDKGPDEKKATS
jgi:hypothetical protein